MNDDEPDLDVRCDVCGQSAAIVGATAVRTEHTLEVWSRLHEHDESQRDAWRAAVAAYGDEEI